jgi:hypothetical protein
MTKLHTDTIDRAVEVLKDYDLEEALQLLTDIVRHPEDFLGDPILGKVAEAFVPRCGGAPPPAIHAAATPP